MKSLWDALHIADPEQPDAPAPEPMPKLTAKAMCRDILNSPQYRRSLIDRIIFKELPPAVECRLWDYAYGKPVERVEMKDKSNPLEGATAEELERRAMLLATLARRLRAGEESHPPLSESDEGSSTQ